MVLVARDEQSRDAMTIGLLVSELDLEGSPPGAPKVKTTQIQGPDLKTTNLSNEIKSNEPGLTLWLIPT
jgi:hypothetical protein